MQNDQRWTNYDPHESFDLHRPQILNKIIYMKYLITLNIKIGIQSDDVIWQSDLFVIPEFSFCVLLTDTLEFKQMGHFNSFRF